MHVNVNDSFIALASGWINNLADSVNTPRSLILAAGERETGRAVIVLTVSESFRD